MAKEKLFPQSQILIMGDGATFPSLYHLWQDLVFRHSDGLVAEVDLYFPTERVAVFCDGRPPESLFDFVQGITALARGKAHQDARLELEGRAKRLLERA